MKRFLIILGLLFLSSFSLMAQEDENDNANDKIRDKMSEFIQRRLNFTRGESDRFAPIFLRYFRDWRTTMRDYRGDKPMLQLRIAELRIKYRTEFREIVGERRSNQVFEQQDIFIQKIVQMQSERMRSRPGGLRRNRMLLD